MPIFNEPATLRACFARVRAARLPDSWTLAPILVDDGSDAATAGAIDALARGSESPVDIQRHRTNRGKGAALQTGFARAIELSKSDCDCVVIQDADLEYDPYDFLALIGALAPFPARCAVFGNRWHAGREPRGWKHGLHRLGNWFLTGASNLATGLAISDMECCYKLIPIGILRDLLPSLTEERFGIEPQIAAALARLKVEVAEVPVAYAPRSFTQGKKIGPRDGVRAIWVIARSKFCS